MAAFPNRTPSGPNNATIAEHLVAVTTRTLRHLAQELGDVDLSNEGLVDDIVSRLTAAPIVLGARYHEPHPWQRSMVAGTGPDLALLRRGVRPGDRYTVNYDVYRITIDAGAELIACAANGGPFIDPMFVFVAGHDLVLRAADDEHRRRLLKDLDNHLDRANTTIAEWNTNELPRIVRRELDRLRRAATQRQHRAAQLAADGFQPYPPNKPEPDASDGVPTEPSEAPPDDASPAVARPTNAHRLPTALISWAHRDRNFTPEQAAARQEVMFTFAQALRESGVDADIDLYHLHRAVDWTRWGPGRMAEVDYVLVVCSERWAEAWRGDRDAGSGAVAEADVLLSWFSDDRERFHAALRLVILPGEDPPIPDRLHGVPRYPLATLDRAGLEDLLRDLTGQPAYVPAPLGQAPHLPSRIPGGSTDTATFASAHGELAIRARPIGLATSIQSVIDEFVADEQRKFEQNEGAADALGDGAVNYSTISFELTSRTPSLISYVAHCSYVMPGSVTSYQQSHGFTFAAADGRRLTLDEVFVDRVSQLATLQRAFLDGARDQLAAQDVPVDNLAATGIPEGATLAVRQEAIGICTDRYAVGPGFLGALVIWIPHERISRVYRRDFARLL